MSANQVPEVIDRKVTLEFTLPAGLYPAGQGWTLSYVAVGPAGKIDIASTAEGDAHRFNVPADQVIWGAGQYRYAVHATNGADRRLVQEGDVQVREDIAELKAGHDTRSHNRRVLEAIEAVIENRATVDQESMTAEGRSLSRTPIEDLIRLKGHYRELVRREEGRPKGKASGRQVVAAFRRV